MNLNDLESYHVNLSWLVQNGTKSTSRIYLIANIFLIMAVAILS